MWRVIAFWEKNHDNIQGTPPPDCVSGGREQSEGQAMKTLIGVGLILTVFSLIAAAETSSVSMQVAIGILEVKLLEVTSEWKIEGPDRLEGGGETIRASTTYGATCIGKDIVIEAILIQPDVEGVIVTVHMYSTMGASLGSIQLSSNFYLLLLMDVKGAEFNIVEIEVTFPPGISSYDYPVEISFLIN